MVAIGIICICTNCFLPLSARAPLKGIYCLVLHMNSDRNDQSWQHKLYARTVCTYCSKAEMIVQVLCWYILGDVVVVAHVVANEVNCFALQRGVPCVVHHPLTVQIFSDTLHIMEQAVTSLEGSEMRRYKNAKPTPTC